MRYYELIIGDKYHFTSKPGFKRIWDINQKVPLHIEFEVIAFSGQPMNTIGYIRLYNIDVDFFIQSQMLISERIILAAGWEDSVFTKKLGWKSIPNSIIINCFIINTLADFSGNQPYIDIFFTPEPTSDLSEAQRAAKDKQVKALQNKLMNEIAVMAVESAKSKIMDKLNSKAMQKKIAQLEKSLTEEGQMELIKCEVKQNEKIFDQIEKAIKLAVPAMKIMAFNSKIDSLVNTSTQTLVITAHTVQQLLIRLGQAISEKIGYVVDSKNGVLEIYVGVPANKKGAKTYKIDRTELITQPQYVSNSEVNVVVRMRPDLLVGDQVEIGGVMPNLSGLINGASMPSITDPRAAFQTGTYTIVSMSHKGSFYSTNASDWATSLTLSADTEYLNSFKRW